jgi:hypothetical protein
VRSTFNARPPLEPRTARSESGHRAGPDSSSALVIMTVHLNRTLPKVTSNPSEMLRFFGLTKGFML